MAEGTGHPAKYPLLNDRVVFITGGASGIGEKLVEAFTLQSAQVAFVDTDDAAASTLIDRLTPNAAHAPVYVPCDLADTAQLAEHLARIVERFGSIEVVINSVTADTLRTEDDDTPEFNDRCTAIDRKHEHFVSQAAVPGMKWQGRGVKVNMSAISWMIPSHAAPVYVASKAAIVDLTRTFARELGPRGVHVHCLLPGAVEAARQRRSWYSEEYANQILNQPAFKRLLRPEEVDRLALFLASDVSGTITEPGLIVDAGWV